MLLMTHLLHNILFAHSIIIITYTSNFSVLHENKMLKWQRTNFFSLGLGIDHRLHLAGTTFGAKSWRWLEGSSSEALTFATDKGGRKSKKTSQKTDGNQKFSFGKNVISQWRSYPLSGSQEVIMNDESYTEHRVDSKNDSSTRSRDSNFTSQSKRASVRNNKRKLKNHTIPIRDYQASLAHSVGTLSRSSMPPTQFESLVTEPSDKQDEANNNYSEMQSTNDNTVDAVEILRDPWELAQSTSASNCYQRRKRDNDRFSSNDYEDKNDFRRVPLRRSCATSTTRKLTEAVNDEDVLRRSRARTMDHVTARNLYKSRWDSGSPTAGLVGQKIAAYEENVRGNTRPRTLESRKHHRGIGVPLVGMHNACGLPVVASWHDLCTMEPMKMSSRAMGNGRPSTHSRRRNRYCQRNCRENQQTLTRSRGHENSSISRELNLRVYGPRIRSKPSFKSRRPTSNCSKASKSKEQADDRLLVDKRYRERSKAKRTTLYARNDGDEAVKVLANLYLNPLTCDNGEEDIIW